MTEPAVQGHRIDAEIFSSGEWNGERFTRRDLHEIARNFRRLRAQLKPPLKFGHDGGQTLLGQHDGDPALGWVEQLWVRGERLMARFVGVPGVVLDAIRAGRYRRVSAELYFNVRRGGRRLGKALKAVALLGADLPAVTNLADLTAYLASTGQAAGGDFGRAAGSGHGAVDFASDAVRAYALPVQAGRIASGEGTASGDRTAPFDSIDSPLTEEPPMPDVDTPPELQAELAELRAFKQRTEQRQSEERRRRQDDAYRSARESAVAFCEGQVQGGRLTPHLCDRLLRELDGQARNFAEGQALRVSFDWVRRFIESAPGTLPRGETAHAASGAGEAAFAADGGSGGGADEANPSVRLARLAANAMTELNLTYGEASAYVLRTHPALARAYRDFTLNPN